MGVSQVRKERCCGLGDAVTQMENEGDWKALALSFAETAIDRFLERRPLSGRESVVVGNLLAAIGQVPQNTSNRENFWSDGDAGNGTSMR